MGTFLLVVFCIAVYSVIAGAVVAFCVAKGIGVEEYQYISDDIFLAVLCGIFWPISIFILIGAFVYSKVRTKLENR